MRQASFEDANGPDYKVLGEGEPQDSLGRPQSLLNPIWSQVTAAMPEKASKVSSVFNLTNTILGSGVIAMPYCCKKAGIVAFVLLLCTVAIASDYAVKLLFTAVDIAVRRHPGEISAEHVSYGMLGKVLGGRKLELLGSWSVTLQQIGCCIAYVVVIGDILEPMGKQWIWDDHNMRLITQLFTIVFIIFPLCLVRRFDSLKFTSFAALCFIMGFVAVAVGYGIKAWITGDGTEVEPGRVKPFPSGGVDMLETLPILSFAFLCHQNTFPIYREMANPSPANMSSVAHWSIAACSVVYLITGIFGYIIKKGETDSDLFSDFEITGSTINIVMDIVRCGFGLSLVLSYPVVVWEARRNLQHLVFGEKEFTFVRYLCINLAIIFVTGTVGIVASGIETVLGLVGSTCSPMMVYVLPPLLFLEAFKKMTPTEQQEHAQMKRFAWLLLAFGVVLIPLCVVLWVLNISDVL